MSHNEKILPEQTLAEPMELAPIDTYERSMLTRFSRRFVDRLSNMAVVVVHFTDDYMGKLINSLYVFRNLQDLSSTRVYDFKLYLDDKVEQKELAESVMEMEQPKATTEEVLEAKVDDVLEAKAKAKAEVSGNYPEKILEWVPFDVKVPVDQPPKWFIFTTLCFGVVAFGIYTVFYELDKTIY